MKLSHITTFYVLQIFRKFVLTLSAKRRYNLSLKFASILFNHTNIRKDQARKNIERAFPKINNALLEKLLKKSYQNFFHNFIELIAFPKTFNEITIKVKGKTKLLSQLKKNKGIIFISGHFGAWEILGQWVAKNVPLFVGVAQKQKNKGAHKFFIKQRELPGTKHIFRGESKEKMYNVLYNNGLLGLVSDQDAKNRGVFVKFFNTPASTPKGAAIFHLKTSAPMLFGVCYKENFQKYIIEFSIINTTTKDIKHITQDYTTQLENYIKKYPDQYFWFHRRWKTKPNK